MKKIIFIPLLFLFASCMPPTLISLSGPPSHAPAHGRRAKKAFRTYHYYPDLEIYWNPTGRTWVIRKNGNWVTVTAKPSLLTAGYTYVVLKSEASSPWKRHKHYKGKYPPGQKKKKHAKHKNHKWK